MTDTVQQYNAPWQTLPGKTMVIDTNGSMVCLMSVMDTRFRSLPMERNARLIAAAPALLTAAEAALEYLGTTLDGSPDDPALAAWNALADALATAQ
jgi:hypothetical protein